MNVGESLAANKLDEFMSLFKIFDKSSDFLAEGVSSSPYIRIAEVLNILDNGLKNPLALMMGNGYGGFYSDSLGLFDRLDLFNAGAFNEADILTGKFTTAHSSIPNALLNR